MTNNTLPAQLQFPANLLLDFGLPLGYQQVCKGYTVEKLSLWQQQTKRDLTTVILKTSHMHRSRLEGILYYITDPKEITDLDNERMVGYATDRVKAKILTPYKDQYGDLIQAEASLYLGRVDYWEDIIGYDQAKGRCGNVIVDNRSEFSLAPTVPDAEKLLNYRFSVLPEPYQTTPERDVSPKMAEHVAWKNRTEINRLRERLAVQEKADRWTRNLHRAKAFLRE